MGRKRFTVTVESMDEETKIVESTSQWTQADLPATGRAAMEIILRKHLANAMDECQMLGIINGQVKGSISEEDAAFVDSLMEGARNRGKRDSDPATFLPPGLRDKVKKAGKP